MFCDLLVFILQASCEQTVNKTSLCDKEMVAQAKVLDKQVESPQMLSNWRALMKFSVQCFGNLANETSNLFVMVFGNK